VQPHARRARRDGRFAYPSHHSLALINLAVQTIENQLFAHAFPEGFLLHCHVQHELIGTVFEALLAFDQEGRVLSANRSACRLIGRSHAELMNHSFSSMFDKSLSALYDPLMRGTDIIELQIVRRPYAVRPATAGKHRARRRAFSAWTAAPRCQYGARRRSAGPRPGTAEHRRRTDGCGGDQGAARARAATFRC
jgi:transcriptional regulator of acetoin/glycerol metabolism